jgi:hypothetical protein
MSVRALLLEADVVVVELAVAAIDVDEDNGIVVATERELLDVVDGVGDRGVVVLAVILVVVVVEAVVVVVVVVVVVGFVVVVVSVRTHAPAQMHIGLCTPQF